METEIKLLFDAKYKAALLRHPLLAPTPGSAEREQALTDTYFDTPDFRLRNSEVGLRVRQIIGDWIQTMKAGGGAVGGVHHRSEWESPVAGPVPELRRLRDLVDDKEVRHELRAGGAVCKRLGPLFATKVRRTVWEIKLADGAHIECAIDRGQVQAGAKKIPISEFELELKSGNPDHLFELALGLLKDIPLRLGNLSKADRGYALLAQTPSSAVKAAALELSREMHVEQALQAIIANCLAHMQGNEEGVCTGHDVESVHQMRVGMRRLRSALNMFKRVVVLPEAFQGELDWLAGELGDARDWDVLVGATLPAAAKVVPDREEMNGVSEAAQARADEHHHAAAAAVASPRYTKLMLSMTRWLRTNGWRHESTTDERRLAQPLLKFARKILKKDQQRLQSRARKLRTATPEARHRVRIAAKKTRYAAEFFNSLFAPKLVRLYVRGLTGLQDELGLLNDAAVADRLLTEISDADPALQANAGFIKGILALRAQTESTQITALWERFKRIPMPT